MTSGKKCRTCVHVNNLIDAFCRHDDEKEKIGPAMPKAAPPMPPMPLSKAPVAVSKPPLPSIVGVPVPAHSASSAGTAAIPRAPIAAAPSLQPVRPMVVVQQQPPMMALPPRPPIAPPRPPMMIHGKKWLEY